MVSMSEKEQLGYRKSCREDLMAKGQDKVPYKGALGRSGGKICDLWCDVTTGHQPETKL